MTTRKPLTARDAIRFLSLHDPNLTNKDIKDRLEWLGLPECSTFLIGQIRGSFRSDMRFLKRAGLLRNRKPTLPDAIRRLKPPTDGPVKEFYYK